MNNFDQSSSGINLTLSCFRDTLMSAMDFEESFRIIQHGGYSTNCIAVYTEFGNVSDEFDFSDADNYQFTVREFREAFLNAGYDKELSQHYFGKPFTKLNRSELVEFLEYQTYDNSERAEFFQENFTPLYETIITLGHCQGDYAEVIITRQFKEFLKENGRTFEQSEQGLSDTIDNLFWNAPIHCRLEIDKDEFYIDELLPDVYEWDKDDVLELIAKNLEHPENVYILKWLEQALPEYPEYQ